MSPLVDIEKSCIQHILITLLPLCRVIEHLEGGATTPTLLLAPPLVNYVPYLYLHCIIGHCWPN